MWAAVGGLALPVAGQAVTIHATGGALGVRAPGFTFVEGDVLDRLRDGRAVRLDFELTVFAEPGRSVIARVERSFNLSFDLWEERFAATRLGTPPESVSHLTDRHAEAWCLSALTIPRAELGRLGPETPFWIRLAYQVPNAIDSADDDSDAFTLRRLIELLSRREPAAIGPTERATALARRQAPTPRGAGRARCRVPRGGFARREARRR